MNCSNLIAELVQTKHVFLLPGGGNAPLVEAFADRAVPMLHEHSCVVAAEAYAQCSGFGVALVTTGPGVTNALTGLAAAYLDSTPVMLISGQVKNEYRATNGLRQRGFQELPNTELTSQLTKSRIELWADTNIVEAISCLVGLATSGRKGPVHVDVPLDVQLAEVTRGHPGLFGRWLDGGIVRHAVDRAVELLAKAERPVLLLGNGARCDEVRELVEAIGLPTLLTWRAADFLDEEHVLFCGRPGIAGQRGANIVQQSADLIICVGARMDIGQVGYDAKLFAPKAKKLVIDIDEAEASKYVGEDGPWSPALGAPYGQERAVCDGAEFLRGLANSYGYPVLTKKECSWWSWCRSMHKKHRPRNAFYDQLSELLQPDDVIVCGSSGTAAESTLQHIKIKRGQRLIFSPGLGSMGFGLPAAIGAQLATGRRVICIEGDGSFAMNSYELETLRHMQLPIKLFVIANGGYASILNSQHKAGYKQVVPLVPSPEFYAEMHGLHNYKWFGQGAMELPHEWFKDSRPLMVEVRADCSLSHRMKTNPPGSPEDMLPELDPTEREQAMRHP